MRSPKIALTVVGALAILVAAAVALTGDRQTGDGIAGRTTPTAFLDRLDRLAGDIGLGLDQVEVSGHRFTRDNELLDAIGLGSARSMLAFDVAAARLRIERLPWIDSAVIERLPPGRLVVTVTERQPYAVWRQGGRDVLIDATGRELAAITHGQASGLPLVSGDRAPQDARRLLDLVAAHPDIARRLERAERVAGRRWRLVLAGGPQIELPADADGAALAMLVEPHPAGRLIDAAAAVIDLTVLRRIAIRPLPQRKRS